MIHDASGSCVARVCHAGLALIPLLPSLVDEPIEEGVHWAFETYWPEEGSTHGHKKAEPKDDVELEKKHA